MKIKTNGIELNIHDTGSGPVTILYLHYWGGAARTWAQVIAAQPAGCRHVAVDLRGWGDSDKPEGGNTLDELVRDIEGVIAALGLARYVIVGHSMGGKVAQRLAARHPAGLLGLVLVAPSPPQPLPLTADQRAMIAHAYDSAETVAGALEHVLTATPLPEALRRQVIEDSLRGSDAMKHAWPYVIMAEDIADAARAIDVPVRVLSGERDQVDPTDALRAFLLPVIAQARLDVLPGRGHLLPLEAPAEVAGAIQGFVDGLDG